MRLLPQNFFEFGGGGAVLVAGSVVLPAVLLMGRQSTWTVQRQPRLERQ